MGQLPLQFAVSQGAASAAHTAHSAAPSAAAANAAASSAAAATLDSQGMSYYPPPCQAFCRYLGWEVQSPDVVDSQTG